MQTISTKALLITIFLLGAGLGLLGFGWGHVREHQRLDQSSAVAEGRVISSDTRPLSRGGQSSTLAVEYTPPNHAAITKTFDVNGDDFRMAQATGKVKVTYWPEEPRVSRVSKFSMLPLQILVGLGLIMLLGGSFCLRFVMWSRIKTNVA